ncbi:MAG: FHA domain-containing protein, partial [Gemmata sp.]
MPSDPTIALFADACGATGPLGLRVDLVGGALLAEGAVAQPFTLVGRDDFCDVTLSDPEINPRHAWLQVIGGRVYAVDLGSRTGLRWPTGASGSGWLDPGAPVRLGPFALRLSAPVSDRPAAFDPDYKPLLADPATRTRPAVALEFRNGKRAKDRWPVNRMLTLVGRSPDCKVHLNADDISLYHCGLVNTRAGLWVVDLSGRGVVVNGERMRVAPLPHGAELWVGRFLIGCHRTAPEPPGGRAAAGP